MFHNYQLKWCFILIGILVVGTGLVKLTSFETLHLAQYLGHVVSIAFSVLIAWLIFAYFKWHPPIKNNLRANVILSGIFANLAVLSFSYFMLLNVPTTFYVADPPFEPTLADFVRRLVATFFLNMICYIVFNTLSTNDILQQTKLENEQFKQAQLRAQLLSLQEQISPHFLFNSLSTLKTITHDADAKQFVIYLSKVYRYLLNINKNQTTKLSEELKFIDAYLYILRTRFEEALQITINVPDCYHNYLIPPLSVQLLIENAIKHNVVATDRPLKIDIYVNEDLKLVVSNPFQPKNNPVESTKLGLQNINDRFRLLFNQEIIVTQSSTHFTIILPLNTHESNHH